MFINYIGFNILLITLLVRHDINNNIIYVYNILFIVLYFKINNIY